MKWTNRISSKYLINFLQFSFINYVQIGLSFFVSIYLARNSTPAEFGVYAYGLVIGSSIIVIMQYGMDKTLVRDIIQLGNLSEKITAAISIWFILGVVSLLAITIWVIWFLDLPNLSKGIVLLVTLSWFIKGMSLQPVFDAKNKHKTHSTLLLADRIFFFVSTLISVYFLHGYYLILAVSFCLVISRLISSALEIRWLYINQKIDFYFSRKDFLRVIKTNLVVWLAALGNLLMTNFNQLILEERQGSEQLAFFSLGFQMIMLLRVFQSQVVRILAPRIAKISSKEFDGSAIFKQLVKLVTIVTLFSLLIAIPIYLLMPMIINEVLGPQYEHALGVVRVLLIWVVIYGGALITNQFLLSLQMQNYFFYTTIFFGIISIFLGWYMVGEYKAEGSALTLIICHLGSIIVQFSLVSNKLLKKRP